MVEASMVVDLAPSTPRRRGTYYKPAGEIRSVPGVVCRQADVCDCYTGDAESLVAAGLASRDMFPGQPGRPAATAAYRPLLDKAELGGSWRDTPGYIEISRRPNGTFRVCLTVGYDEQKRRRQLLPHAVMVKEGSILLVTVRGPLTDAGLTTLRRDATRQVLHSRASACLLDLADCDVQFNLGMLSRGFLDEDRGVEWARPSALLIPQHRLEAFRTVSTQAANCGVLMLSFTSRERALEFLEAEAALWWTHRLYPGQLPARLTPADPAALARAAKDASFQAILRGMTGGAANGS
jgi:hypothetical protein